MVTLDYSVGEEESQDTLSVKEGDKEAVAGYAEMLTSLCWL